MRIGYPVPGDNDYRIWQAFSNNYWPALYFVDREGVIRDEHFGEGRYEQSDRVIQELLGIDQKPVRSRGTASRRRPTGTTSSRPRRTSDTHAGSVRATGRRRRCARTTGR